MSSPEEMMDPSIWGALPLELLERILCFLPLKTVINLRPTCKRIKSLVYRNSFITQHHSSSSSSSSSCCSSSLFSSFLILSHPHFNHNNQFLLYDFTKSIWRTSTLPPPTTNNSPQFTSLVSSSNGLLCFTQPNSTTSSSFLIRSFFPRTSSIVHPPHLPFSYELLTLIPSPTGFKLLIISSGSSSNSIFIYDSDSDPSKSIQPNTTSSCWKHFTDYDRIIRDNYHQEGVYRNGSLFFTSTTPFSVVKFNLDTGKLDRHTADLPRELTFMRLVDHVSNVGGEDDPKFYMFGGVGANGISRTLKLWELVEEEEENKWVEVETLPDLMYRKFVSVCYHNYEHVYCFWHQGLVCICCYTWPEILYYKVSRRTWHWLPKCPSLPQKWSFGFKWFSFAPRLIRSASSG